MLIYPDETFITISRVSRKFPKHKDKYFACNLSCTRNPDAPASAPLQGGKGGSSSAGKSAGGGSGAGSGGSGGGGGMVRGALLVVAAVGVGTAAAVTYAPDRVPSEVFDILQRQAIRSCNIVCMWGVDGCEVCLGN